MNRIKEVLDEKGKSQSWLAAEIKVSRQIVSRYCANDSQPLIETLFEIAKALNVPPAKLLGDGVEIEEKK